MGEKDDRVTGVPLVISRECPSRARQDPIKSEIPEKHSEGARTGWTVIRVVPWWTNHYVGGHTDRQAQVFLRLSSVIGGTLSTLIGSGQVQTCV